MVSEEHLCCWHTYANSMVNKKLFFLLSAVMLGLSVDDGRFAVGHISNVMGIFVQGHMPVM